MSRAPEQLVLPLPTHAADGREAFYATPCNQAALDAVEAWPAWPSGMLVVIAPQGSGKTHLSSVLRARMGLAGARWSVPPAPAAAHVIADDADRRINEPGFEEALFHAAQRAVLGEGTLFLTGTARLAQWGMRLKDLSSRLSLARHEVIQPADDALLRALLLKLFADRQLRIRQPAKVIESLIFRMPRSAAAAAVAVAQLDQMSAAAKSAITPELAARVAAMLGPAGP